LFSDISPNNNISNAILISPEVNSFWGDSDISKEEKKYFFGDISYSIWIYETELSQERSLITGIITPTRTNLPIGC